MLLSLCLAVSHSLSASANLCFVVHPPPRLPILQDMPPIKAKRWRERAREREREREQASEPEEERNKVGRHVNSSLTRKTDWEHKLVQFFWRAAPAICLLGAHFAKILGGVFWEHPLLQKLRKTVLAICLLGAQRILSLRPAFFQRVQKNGGLRCGCP